GPLMPAAEVAIVVSSASKWMFEYQGPVRQPHGWADPLGYVKTLQSMYEIAYSAGLGVRLIGDNQLPPDPALFASQHPVMILHSLYIASDETLQFAREYARAGGRLIVGPRTGYAKPDAVIRTDAAPAILGEAGGVTYSEYSMLAKNQPAVAASGEVAGAGWAWFDELEATSGTDVDLTLDHPFFGLFAAMTSRKFGSGYISFLATYPDQQLSSWLGQHIVAGLDIADLKFAPFSASDSIVVNRATTADGRLVSFVFNWSWQTAEVTLAVASEDVESGAQLAAGAKFELGAWGVRVLVSGR
ncbi:MAG: hypothetical protein RJA35_910, partial [Actinomycetota bacterium]